MGVTILSVLSQIQRSRPLPRNGIAYSRIGILLASAAACSGALVFLLLASYTDALAFLTLFGIALVFVRSPRNIFLFLLAIRPFFELYVNARFWHLSVGQLWSGCIFVMAVILALYHYRQPLRSLITYSPVLALITLYPVFTLWRPGAGTAFVYEIKVVAWIAVLIAIERIVSNDEDGVIAVIVTAVSMTIALLGVIAFAYASDHYGNAYYHFSGSSDYMKWKIQEPHGLANFAVMLTPFILYVSSFKRARIFSYVLLLGIAVGVLLSYVRSAWLGLAILVLAFLAILIMRYGRRALAFFAIGGMPVLVYAYSIHSSISTRVLHGNMRLTLWRPCIDHTVGSVQTLLLGDGARACTIANGLVAHNPVWSNSDPIELFGSGGIILALAYLMFVGWLFWSVLAPGPRLLDRDDLRELRLIGVATCVSYVVISAVNGILWNAVSLGFVVFIGFFRGVSRSSAGTGAPAETATPTGSLEPERRFGWWRNPLTTDR